MLELFEAEYEALSNVPNVMMSESEFLSGRRQQSRFAPLHSRLESNYPEPDASVVDASDWNIAVSIPNSKHSGVPVDLYEVYSILSQTNAEDEEVVTDLASATGLDVHQLLKDMAYPDLTDPQIIKTRIDEHGVDALGCYLPWHGFVKCEEQPWGTYLFLENILAWTSDVYHNNKRLAKNDPRSSIMAVFRFCMLVALRHEIFHYQVEKYALKIEASLGHHIYSRYFNDVFLSCAGTADWLEEALAQAVVLDHPFMKQFTGLFGNTYGGVAIEAFRSFPDGYKDYRCYKHGGVSKAHRILATQIIRGNVDNDYTATDLSLPVTESVNKASRELSCYISYRQTVFSKYRCCCPSRKKTRQFLKKFGSPNPSRNIGDHEGWSVKNQNIQMNPKSSTYDIASFKALAKSLGVNLNQLDNAIRMGKKYFKTAEGRQLLAQVV